MGLLLPVVAALVAILILPGWSFYFDVIPKAAVVLAGASLLLWKPRFARVSPLPWILGALALSILLSAALSTHRWFSFYGSTWRRSGLIVELSILLLTAGVAGSIAGRLREWLRVMALPGLPIGVYAIFQYFGIDPLMNPAGYRFGEGQYMIVRPPGTFGHAAYLATYLLFIVFAGVALTRMETAAKWKWPAWAVCAVAIFAIVLSGTRAAILGLIAGALFVAIREGVKWNRVAWSGLALVVAIGAFYVSPAGGRLRARVFWSSEDALGGARLMLWRDTLRMSEEHWAFGYGPETFSMEFPRQESLELARKYPDFYHESPHNIFLDALISQGVFGLAGLVALAVLGLTAARGWLGGALVAMLVSQQFTSFTIATQLYFYLCVAILAAMQLKNAPASDGVMIRPLVLLGSRVVAAGLAGAVICLLAGDFMLGAARHDVDHGEAGQAPALVDRAREMHEASDIYFSLRFLNARNWPAAIHAAVEAPRTADDPQNALVNLAAVKATVNDAAGVETSLRQAIAAAPNWYKPRWLLAQVLELGGRITEAKTEARAAADRDGGKHPEVQATLERILAR